MSDALGLLDRISAFRQRLEAAPRIVPEAVPTDPADTPRAVAAPEQFRHSLRQITGAVEVNEGPVPPPLTDRARKLLADAKREHFALYNVVEDVAETRDRSAEQPEQVRKLRAALERLYREINP